MVTDMHVHLMGQTTAKPSPDRYAERFYKNEAFFALGATQYAKTTLLSGFTTVRDLGGGLASLALRDAINAGYVERPRIFALVEARCCESSLPMYSHPV